MKDAHKILISRMFRKLLNKDIVIQRDIKRLSQLSIWAILERKVNNKRTHLCSGKTTDGKKKTKKKNPLVFDSTLTTGSNSMPPDLRSIAWKMSW